MAKLFDGANRYILFIQLLALLLGVCFISPSLQLSEKRLLPRNTEAVECDSLVGNSTCMCQADGVWSGSYINTSIVIISESTPITAGNTGVFVCVAHGCPVPSLTWSRDGTPLGNSSRLTILEELVNENGVTFVQSILVICSLEEDDTAQYNCSASNNVSFASASFNLTVNCGSNNDNESTPGVVTTTTITAIIIPLSSVVSFIVGVLVGGVVTYCTVRRKHAVALSGDLNQPMEQSNTVYEDVTDLQYPENIGLSGNAAYNMRSIDVENIGLNGNAAYNLRSIDGGDDIQSQDNDSYYWN